MRDVVLAMEEEAGVRLKVLKADGGMAQNRLFLKIQADLLGVPVAVPEVTETTALGAALMAGVGAGALSPEDVAGRFREAERFLPTMPEGRREALYRRWREAVERAKGWAREG